MVACDRTRLRPPVTSVHFSAISGSFASFVEFALSPEQFVESLIEVHLLQAEHLSRALDLLTLVINQTPRGLTFTFECLPLV